MAASVLNFPQCPQCPLSRSLRASSQAAHKELIDDITVLAGTNPRALAIVARLARLYARHSRAALRAELQMRERPKWGVVNDS